MANCRGSRESSPPGCSERGLEPRPGGGDHAAHRREYFFAFFGILLAGAMPVPIYPPARLSQIEEHLRRHAGILANARARC